MKKIFFIISIFIIFQSSCKHDSIVAEPEIDVFNAGVGENGFLYADKSHTDNNSKEWKGSCFSSTNEFKGKKYLSISAYTYLDQEYLIFRETLSISEIPPEVGIYSLHPHDPLRPEVISALYGRLVSDGDAAGAIYEPDDSKNNTLSIDEIDLVNKRVKGTFNVSFKMQRMYEGAGFEDKVAFKNGHFDVKIAE